MKNFFLFLILGLMIAGCAAGTYTQTTDGVRLIYERHEVPHAKGNVILLHGMGSDLDEWFSFRKKLEKDGWSTLAFDFRGHGMSRNWKDEELDWRKFNATAMGSALHDVEAVAGLIHGDKPLWLIGSSFGANMALKYAASHPAVSGLVLFSPGLDYAGVEIEPSLKAYNGRPLMMVASAGDHYAAKSVDSLSAVSIEPHKIKIYEDAEAHGQLMLESIPELEKEVLQWMNFNTNLK